jgi:hypothetical protein
VGGGARSPSDDRALLVAGLQLACHHQLEEGDDVDEVVAVGVDLWLACIPLPGRVDVAGRPRQTVVLADVPAGLGQQRRWHLAAHDHEVDLQLVDEHIRQPRVNAGQHGPNVAPPADGRVDAECRIAVGERGLSIGPCGPHGLGDPEGHERVAGKDLDSGVVGRGRPFGRNRICYLRNSDEQRSFLYHIYQLL